MGLILLSSKLVQRCTSELPPLKGEPRRKLVPRRTLLLHVSTKLAWFF
jgi:hypothetical protein